MDAKTQYAWLVLALAASYPAAAQSVGDLANVQADTLLIRAQAQRAEAQAALEEANRKSVGGVAELQDQDAMPVVRGVYGTSGKLYATFLYPNGSTVDAGEGARIPGDFVVRSLSATSVVLGKHGRTVTVGFSDVTPMTSSAAGAQAAPPASRIPPLPDPTGPVPAG